MINRYNNIESLIHNKRKHIDDVRVKRFWNIGRQKTRKHSELPNVAKGRIINGNILFVSRIASSIRWSDNEMFMVIYKMVIGRIMPLTLITTLVQTRVFSLSLSVSAFISFIYLIINREGVIIRHSVIYFCCCCSYSN